MTTGSPIVKALLIIFAIIGLLALLGFVGMLFMHSSMMGGMMGSFSGMADACRNAMSARL